MALEDRLARRQARIDFREANPKTADDLLNLIADASGVQMAGGLLQKGISALERRRARQNFSPYQIPASARAGLNKMTSLSTQRGVIGEDIYRSRVQSNIARGIESAQRTSESPGDVQSVLDLLHGRGQQFEQNMAVQGSNMYEQRQNNLMNTLMRFSQFETDRWRYNELYPYMQAMGAAGDLDAAGNKNLQSAFSTGMNVMGTKADIAFQQDMFNQLKEWKLGANTGEPFGRTRQEESQLRNLPQPDVSGWQGDMNQNYRTPIMASPSDVWGFQYMK